MAKTKTNEAFLRDLMRSARNGVLVQAFIIDSLFKMSEAVSKADPKEMDSGFMNGHAWVAAAKEVHDALQANYGRKS